MRRGGHLYPGHKRTLFGNNSDVVSAEHVLLDVTDPQNVLTIQNDSNAQVENVDGGLLVWGDPHIRTIYGTTTIAHEGVFELFNDKKLVVNVECWKDPRYNDHPNIDIREGTFLKTVGFVLGGEGVRIDMRDLSHSHAGEEEGFIRVYNEGADWKDALREYRTKDKGAACVLIRAGGCVFACALLPNMEGV